MIVKDLNGKDFNWNPRSNPRNAPSLLHVKARDLLKELFPFDLIYEEVYVTKMKMYLDLYIPSRKIAIEVQGSQHFEFNSHFHNTKMDFYKGKVKDSKKREWCELNNIKFVELPFNGDLNEWRQSIQS